jgi:hypothetical protein
MTLNRQPPNSETYRRTHMDTAMSRPFRAQLADALLRPGVLRRLLIRFDQ